MKIKLALFFFLNNAFFVAMRFCDGVKKAQRSTSEVMQRVGQGR